MIFPLGPLLYPRLQGGDLLWRELCRRAGGRHPLCSAFIFGRYPLPDQGPSEVAGCDRVLAVAEGEGRIVQIEPQLALARRRIGPVALKTMLCENRSDFFQVADAGTAWLAPGLSGWSPPSLARWQEPQRQRQARCYGNACTEEPPDVDEREHCEPSGQKHCSPPRLLCKPTVEAWLRGLNRALKSLA